MNIARNGDHALIIDLDSLDDVVDLHAQIQALDLPQVRELVPAARTITVHLRQIQQQPWKHWWWARRRQAPCTQQR